MRDDWKEAESILHYVNRTVMRLPMDLNHHIRLPNTLPLRCEENTGCRCQSCVEWAIEVGRAKNWSGWGGTWNHPFPYD